MARAPAPSCAARRSRVRARGGAGGAHRAPPAPPAHCPVCASSLRRRIELRLFRGATAAQALAGLGRGGLSAHDVRAHFESGHVLADPALLIASLLALLGESAAGTRSSAAASLAAINQNHKLRLEVIKLIAGIGEQSRSVSAPRLVSQTINMLLSDEQAGEMRKLATARRRTSAPRR